MLSQVKISDVQTVLTQPAGSRLVVVKVITSEPGLYGVGCATFTQRFQAVHSAIQDHLRPLLIGRDVDRIEETFQLAMVNGYWRNGPVLNNAISGVDMALWDIKGKRAGMPVYQLLGGKCREGAATYAHADGRDRQEVVDNVRRFEEQGYRHIRIQLGGYGGHASDLTKPEGAPEGAYYDPRAYCRNTLDMIEFVRAEVGPEVELLHDIHERLRPIEAMAFAKDVEPCKLFFLEDPLAPEDLEWFRDMRQQCATPIAMGELFNHPREWTPLVQDRLIDFVRMHVSQMGGLTPARNVATFAQMYGIRTAWHGPGDVSPVGHAANLHLDLWAPNFGVQEWCRFPELVYEMFPGTPEV
ncbi:MAG: enolase C-terminal domain-like protein, partial [Candidatus Latescibacteria bacterium]|nr:enolase C-terminal domain-like protein [Candidatus Latescibacterota bacterium]